MSIDALYTFVLILIRDICYRSSTDIDQILIHSLYILIRYYVHSFKVTWVYRYWYHSHWQWNNDQILCTQALRHDERFHVLQYCLDIDWRYWYYVFRCININKKYFVHAWVDTACCFSYFLLNEAFSLSLTCDLLFYLQITVFVS